MAFERTRKQLPVAAARGRAEAVVQHLGTTSRRSTLLIDHHMSLADCEGNAQLAWDLTWQPPSLVTQQGEATTGAQQCHISPGKSVGHL